MIWIKPSTLRELRPAQKKLPRTAACPRRAGIVVRIGNAQRLAFGNHFEDWGLGTSPQFPIFKMVSKG